MNCSLGEPFVDNLSFKVVVTVQAILSALALVINPLVFPTVCSKMYFHKNIRLLLACGIMVNILHSFFYVIQQSTHSYLMWTAQSGCDVLVSPAFCNVLRIPAYLCLLYYTAINNCMVIERLVATIKIKTYEGISTAFGMALCGCSLLYVLVFGLFTVKAALFVEYGPYCSPFNSENVRQLSWLALAGILMEVVVLLLFIIVFYVNKWMEKNQRYNVKIRFQVRENLAVCRTLAPWMFFHFATVIFLMASSYLVPILFDFDVDSMESRTILAAVYIFPLFCLISPIALKEIYKNEQKRRRAGIQSISKPVTSEQYYLAYTAGWDKK